MSRSNDAGHFFQTSDSLATTERKAAKAKNKHGNPIRLPSKILAAIPDPQSDHAVYVAEAAGEVKRVVLEVCKRTSHTYYQLTHANGEDQTDKVQKVFTQGIAPLTCITISNDTSQIFAGSWDKNIYRVDISTKQTIGRPLQGHTDFVKCLLATCINGKPILLSGGADATIIVWDIETGKQLYKLKGHTKSLQDLALDPLSIPEGGGVPTDSFVLFSASSDREIRRWHIGADKAFELPESLDQPVLAHETSVYKLCFDSDGDLWTASADKTAKHLVRSREWEADTTLVHPDFVRDVVVNEQLGMVITACRDEEVRVWDASSGDLLCTYSGHFEEATGLVLLGHSVVSVSIDGTVRRWGLRRQDMMHYEEEVKKEMNGEVEDGAKKGERMLTAEEEAELAELMDDSD
jgi:WD40 repeat protein